MTSVFLAPSNLLHLLGVFLVVAGLSLLIVSLRRYRRPGTPPEPSPEPPGSLFIPNTPPGRKR